MRFQPKHLLVTLCAWLLGASAFATPPLLLHAVCKNDMEMLEMVMKQVSDVNDDKHGFLKLTALDLALLNGHDKMVDKLLASGAKPTWQSYYYPCNKRNMELLCGMARDPSVHEGCRFLESGSEWRRQCKSTEGNCAQILR